MIEYVDTAKGIEAGQLRGFFAGWPDPPSAEAHLSLLRGSSHVVLAIDSSTKTIVGFITAISDGVLTAYLPLLEVLEAYRGRGIGGVLVRRMLDRLGGLYSVGLHCDPELEPYYAALGMEPLGGMVVRNHGIR